MTAQPPPFKPNMALIGYIGDVQKVPSASTGPYGFRFIHERMNIFTGAWVRLDPPQEVHTDDLDWLERLWEESDRLDYELMRAGAQ